MFSITRSLLRQRQTSLNLTRNVKIKIVPFQEPPKENYFERNMRLKKALSPSLGIYKPEITTVLSISHRITGTILSGYTSFLGIGALVCPHDMSHCIPSMLDSFNMSSTTVTILKFLFAFPFAYHFCAGARHLIWDTGMFLNDKMVTITGIAVVLSAIVLTAFLSMLPFQ